MKFVFIADLHLSFYSNDKIDSESNLPERLSSILRTLKNVLDWSRKNHISNIVIGGDIYHTKSLIHTVVQNEFLKVLKEYYDLQFTMIDGNHDMSNRTGTGVSALRAFEEFENVSVIHETQQIGNVLFVPWYSKMIEDVKRPNDADYLVAHFGLNEAELSSGISIVADIKLSDLKQYKKCFLGHYHKPQKISNVYYVGSLIQLDRGERNEEKRFLVVDTDTGDVKSYPTTGYKKFIQLDATQENFERIKEQATLLKEEGHHITIALTENNIKIDNSIKEEFQIIDKTEKDISNRGITTSMSQKDRLKKYLEIKEIPTNKTQKYLDKGIEVINAVRSDK